MRTRCGSFGTLMGEQLHHSPQHNSHWNNHSSQSGLMVSFMVKKTHFFMFGFDGSKDIVVEYKHKSLKFPSGKLISLDLYSPSHRIAFEYQGELHFWHHFKSGMCNLLNELTTLIVLTIELFRFSRPCAWESEEKWCEKDDDMQAIWDYASAHTILVGQETAKLGGYNTCTKVTTTSSHNPQHQNHTTPPRHSSLHCIWS